MAVSILGTIRIFNWENIVGVVSPTATVSHTVTSGTDTLLALYLARVKVGGTTPVFTAAWNGVAVPTLSTNYVSPDPFNDIVYWMGALNAPAAGAFNFTLNASLEQTGGPILLFNLDGCDTAALLGPLSAQRSAATATSSVALTITPQTSGGMVVGLFGIAQVTTAGAWTGTSYTVIGSGAYGNSNSLTWAARYRPDVTGAQTVGSAFALSDDDIGGLLFEIRSANTTFDVAATVAGTALVAAASQGGASRASTTLPDSVLEGRDEFTTHLILEADDTGQDRNLLRIGTPSSLRFAIERRKDGTQGGAVDVFACSYELGDGRVEVESASGMLSTSLSVVSVAQIPGDGGQMTADGFDLPASSRTGAELIGGPLLGAVSVAELGAHSGLSGPPAYAGSMARWLVDHRFRSLEERQLFWRSVRWPERLFGWGAPDAPTEANRSPVACPIFRALRGGAALDIPVLAIDPDGTQPTLATVGSAGHGTSSQVDVTTMRYVPAAGFLGEDSFPYTVADASGKTSSSVVVVDVVAQGLLAVADAVSVDANSSAGITFDPKANDTGGAGPVTVESITDPTHGTATLLSSGLVNYIPTSGYSGPDSFTYTVFDGETRASGDVAVTVAAVALPVAQPDSATTTVGTEIVIPVTANDTPADVIVDLVTVQPSNGTTTIETGQKSVRYRPATGFQGQDPFTYRIRRPTGTATSTAQCTVSVTQAPVPTGLEKYPPALPTAAKQRCVGFAGPTGSPQYAAGRAGLVAALAEANAGDHIVLADGTYSGASVVVSRGGSANNHVVIRARNHLMATFTCRLDVTAEFVWITGFTSNYRVDLTGVTEGWAVVDANFICRRRGFRLTNNHITGSKQVHIVYSTTFTIDQIIIAYNHMIINSPATWAQTHMISVFAVPNNRPPPANTEIAYNVMRQNTPLNSGTGRMWLSLQDSKVLFDSATTGWRTFHFHHNHCVGYMSDHIYNKRHMRIGFNYFESLSTPGLEEVVIRHGRVGMVGFNLGGLIEANRFAGVTTNIRVNGNGMTLNGNVGNLGVILSQGSASPNGSVLYQAADYTTFVDHAGTEQITLGFIWSGYTASASEGGLPDNVRFFAGDAGIPSNIVRVGATPAPSTASGFGGYAKVIAPTGAALLPLCGSDPP
jgi:hypothetical protein